MPETPTNDTSAADAATDRQVLPLLPLTTGVVFPNMVVTLALETDDAKRAAAAAGDGEGLVLLVPRVGARYARVGTVARIESTGELPGGPPALVLRGLHRAVVGVGVAGTGDGLWVEIDPVADTEPSERGPRAGPRVPGDRERHRRAHRRGPPHRGPARGQRPRRARRHRRLVARPRRRPQGRPARGRSTSSAASSAVVAWARDALAEMELAGRIRDEVSSGHGEDPARLPPAPADGRDPQGAG